MILLNESSLMEPQRLVWPPGWVGHIPFASWIIALLRPSLFVELGTHSGNSYSAFCQAILREKCAAQAFAVDTWKGDDHAGSYDDSVFLDLQAFHDPAFGSFSTLLRSSFDDAVSRFSDGSIDLLHIDGLHTYEAVKHDFETWRPKLSKRAVVLFHDTCVHTSTFGVHRLWDELAAEYPGFNFKHSNGLGVLLVGPERNPDLQALANSAGQGDGRLASDFFRVLGSAVERQARIAFLEQELAQRDLQIGGVTQALESSGVRLAELQGNLAAKDAQLAEIQGVLASNNAALTESERLSRALTANVSAQVQHIVNLTSELVEKDALIAQLQAAGSERDRQTSDLRNSVAEHEERAAALASKVGELEASVATSREEITIRDANINSNSEMIELLSRELDEAKAVICVGQHEAETLRHALTERDASQRELSRQLDEAKAAICNVEQEANNLRRALTERDASQREMSRQLDEAKAAICNGEQEANSLRRALAERNASVSELRVELDDLRNSLAEQRRVYEACDAERLLVLRDQTASETALLRYQSHWIFRILSHPKAHT